MKICGSNSIDCDNKCGAVLCNKCGHHDENYERLNNNDDFLSELDANCANGMESSFKRFVYFNNTYHTIYAGKEEKLKSMLINVTKNLV